MRIIKYPLFLIFLFLIASLSAQVTGLWEAVKVSVGVETVTPVAKWFLLTEDMKSVSGNGGVENSRGTYTYDYVKSEFLFYGENGKPDPFGAFRVQKEDGEMTWTRKEEGMDVQVTLRRVDEKPLAPWDKIVGNWMIISSSDDKPVEGKAIQVRWDRRYRCRNGAFGENQYGVWHIHGHKPELRLISDQGDNFDSAWDISFEENQLTLIERDTDTPITLKFTKIED